MGRNERQLAYRARLDGGSSGGVMRLQSLLSITPAAALVVCSTAWAADDAKDSPPLQQIVVISSAPVPGLNIDADKIPGNTQSLNAADLNQDGAASIINGLANHLGSVSINDTLADPFQPDILYRGFEASPVLGTPQGLAVYQNGVRINEAFGDTVDWDLFPDIAIGRVDIVSSNPLYGLNALGGALSVTMKNGFTFQGVDAGVSGGSFNQRQGSAEYGMNSGAFGFYGAARILDQDGWRLFAHDLVRQYYMDVSYHEGRVTLDLSYARADNQLSGQGAAPIQSLEINSADVFTGPQNNINRLNFITLNAAFALTDTFSAQAILYSRNFRQTVANGDSSQYTGCLQISALCQADGLTALTDAAGALLPDITDGGANIIGQNDFERISTDGLGGSLQLTSNHTLLGQANAFAVGATFDTARTHFVSGTQVGILSSELTVLPSDLALFTPENSVDSAGEPVASTPVGLNTDSKYYGIYITDTFDVTSQLAVTASARYNSAKVELVDQLGANLNGGNRFTHLNPAIGASFKLLPNVTVFGGLATNNRTPTASEIECSNPQQPCLLPSSLASDPPNLKQVVAKSTELGFRGHLAPGSSGGILNWNASVFRTNSEDDIYAISTSISTGFFQNIGSTRRQGFETGLTYHARQWSAYAQYSYVDATFRSPLLLNSPSNPFQNDDGDIQVLPGDHLPLIPKNRLKMGGDYSMTPDWSVGASFTFVSNSFYKGDESNQNPQLPGELFANVQNLFDQRYSTLGLFGNPTGVNAPGVPVGAESNGPGVDNRFQSPGMPRAYFGGVRFSF
jgi:iron complex outermembrane receptor protein